MKYAVLISDLTADQARSVITEIETIAEFIQRGQSVNVVEQASTPLNITNIQEQPAAQTAGQTANVAGVERDINGLPWDDRIHSGSKAKNKDGSWKKKKGVQPVEVSTVEAELRAAPASLPTVATVAALTPPTAPVMSVAQVPVAAPVAPPMPQAAPVAAPIPAKPTRDFQGFMTQISNLFQSQRIDQTYPPTIIDRINQGFAVSLNTITDIANNPQHIEYAWQCLEVDEKAI